MKKDTNLRYIYFGRGPYEKDKYYLGYNVYPFVFSYMVFVDKKALGLTFFKNGKERKTYFLKIISRLQKFKKMRTLIKTINLLVLKMWGHKSGSKLVAEVIYPGQLSYLDKIKPDCIGYHLHDEYESYPAYSREEIYREKKELMEKVDYIHAVSPMLSKKADKWQSAIFLQPNGVEFEYFQEVASQIEVDPNKIVILSRAIKQHHIDFTKEVLQYNKNLKVALIGECLPEISKLLSSFEKEKRVIWTGLLSYHEIVKEVCSACVCLSIYSNLKFSKANSPLKIMMYFAAGKPTVATSFGTESLFPENSIYISNEPKKFASLVSKAHEEYMRQDLIELRKNFAKSNSWELLIKKKFEFIGKIAGTI